MNLTLNIEVFYLMKNAEINISDDIKYLFG